MDHVAPPFNGKDSIDENTCATRSGNSGGKGRRSIELTSINDDVMFLETTGYAKRAPARCPIIKARTGYGLLGDKLTEMRRK